MTVALTFTNIDKVMKGLDGVQPLFLEEFKTRVEARTPVLTGLLKASYSWEVKSKTVAVLSNDAVNKYGMGYFTFVENGTPKMAPRLMVATTVLESFDILKVACQKAGIL